MTLKVYFIDVWTYSQKVGIFTHRSIRKIMVKWDKCEEMSMLLVYLIDEEDWQQPIIDYLEYGKLSTDPWYKIDVQRRAPRFIYYKWTLYHCSLEGLFVWCLGKEESIKVLQEEHLGVLQYISI